MLLQKSSVAKLVHGVLLLQSSTDATAINLDFVLITIWDILLASIMVDNFPLFFEITDLIACMQQDFCE